MEAMVVSGASVVVEAVVGSVAELVVVVVVGSVVVGLLATAGKVVVVLAVVGALIVVLAAGSSVDRPQAAVPTARARSNDDQRGTGTGASVAPRRCRASQQPETRHIVQKTCRPQEDRSSLPGVTLRSEAPDDNYQESPDQGRILNARFVACVRVRSFDSESIPPGQKVGAPHLTGYAMFLTGTPSRANTS